MDLKVNFALWSKIDKGDVTNYKNKILKVQLQKFLQVGFFNQFNARFLEISAGLWFTYLSTPDYTLLQFWVN